MSAIVKAIINNKAGTQAKRGGQDDLASSLQVAFPGIEVTFTDPTTDVTDWTQKAVTGGATMVIAGGGDGTINAVASVLVGTQVVLGVLPLGTLNHFAKSLGMPTDIGESVQALADGQVDVVDVGEVNDRIFLNNASLGLYPTIVKIRESKQQKGVSKWPAAAYATVKAVSKYRLLTIFVKVDGKELTRRTPMVFVGNNEYEMDGVGVPSRSTLNDGQLCLYIPRATKRGRMLWFSCAHYLEDRRLGNTSMPSWPKIFGSSPGNLV